MKCNCGGDMSLSVRVAPKPYKYRLTCACGKSLPADETKARQSLQYAITQVVLCVLEEGGSKNGNH